jgi:hypothetical protein
MKHQFLKSSVARKIAAAFTAYADAIEFHHEMLGDSYAQATFPEVHRLAYEKHIVSAGPAVKEAFDAVTQLDWKSVPQEDPYV